MKIDVSVKEYSEMKGKEQSCGIQVDDDDARQMRLSIERESGEREKGE